MIRNRTMLDHRIKVFEDFVESNSHLKSREFKASEVNGYTGSRWDRIHFNGNGNMLSSLVDWGLLKVVRQEKGTIELGGYETKEVFETQSGIIYPSIDVVSNDVFVKKVFKQIPNTVETFKNVYAFTITHTSRREIVQQIGRTIYNLVDKVHYY